MDRIAYLDRSPQAAAALVALGLVHLEPLAGPLTAVAAAVGLNQAQAVLATARAALAATAVVLPRHHMRQVAAAALAIQPVTLMALVASV